MKSFVLSSSPWLVLLILAWCGAILATPSHAEATTGTGTSDALVPPTTTTTIGDDATPLFRKRRRRVSGSRRLLCLGIFRDCDEEEDDEDEDEDEGATATNETEAAEEEDSDSNGGGGLLGDIELCLGIFRECNTTEDEDGSGSDTPENEEANNSTTSTPAPATAPVAAPSDGDGGDAENEEGDNGEGNEEPNCDEVSGGIFGGRPLFGECGIITELIESVFGDVWNTTDTDGDGDVDEISFGSDDSDKGPFGLGLLPEGGLLWRVWNRDESDDLSVIEIISQAFQQNTQSFTSAFLDEWSESAVPTNDTCVNDAAAPACLDVLGQEGFWVCRTLSDPYTGVPSSKNVCVGQGGFLENNDACGCCTSSSASPSNGNTTTSAAAPLCPATCPCTCDLGNDSAGSGVWITAAIGESRINRCVDSRWAVSITTQFDRIQCLVECPSE